MNYDQFLPERGLPNGTVLEYYGKPAIVIDRKYYKYECVENGQRNFESFVQSNKIESYLCIGFDSDARMYIRPYEVKVLAKTVGEYFRDRLHNAFDKISANHLPHSYNVNKSVIMLLEEQLYKAIYGDPIDTQLCDMLLKDYYKREGI